MEEKKEKEIKESEEYFHDTAQVSPKTWIDVLAFQIYNALKETSQHEKVKLSLIKVLLDSLEEEKFKAQWDSIEANTNVYCDLSREVVLALNKKKLSKEQTPQDIEEIIKQAIEGVLNARLAHGFRATFNELYRKIASVVLGYRCLNPSIVCVAFAIAIYVEIRNSYNKKTKPTSATPCNKSNQSKYESDEFTPLKQEYEDDHYINPIKKAVISLNDSLLRDIATYCEKHPTLTHGMNEFSNTIFSEIKQYKGNWKGLKKILIEAEEKIKRKAATYQKDPDLQKRAGPDVFLILTELARIIKRVNKAAEEKPSTLEAVLVELRKIELIEIVKTEEEEIKEEIKMDLNINHMEHNQHGRKNPI